MESYKLATGSTIFYPEKGVLAPDVVTEMLALEAVKALREKGPTVEPRILLELGIGTGAFSRFVLDAAGVQLHVVGVDANRDALATALINLRGHKNLAGASFGLGNWQAEDTFRHGPFDCVYFNPPYLRAESMLRPEFANSPSDAVISKDPAAEYRTMLPKIVHNLAIGGIAIVRYPGDGTMTYAEPGSTPDRDNPWITLDEADRVVERIKRRYAWMDRVMPPDKRVFTWQTGVDGRRVNAEIFTRIGDDIQNAPKIIRDMEAYWAAYDRG